jgi:hypothetical protein
MWYVWIHFIDSPITNSKYMINGNTLINPEWPEHPVSGMLRESSNNTFLSTTID